MCEGRLRVRLDGQYVAPGRARKEETKKKEIGKEKEEERREKEKRREEKQD